MGDGIMTNPNNNKNFNDEALKINRKLKKELDSLKSLIQDFDKFLIGYNVTSDVEDREIGELQERIRSCFEDDDSQTLEASQQDDYWSKQKAVKILHKKAMEVEE